jgi:NAD(P)H-hydrate repair Nnr-like enzyme with NAD(P)H-hydrate dehydratase domain
MSSFQAAVAGAWIHASAGIHASKSIGNDASVLAGDVLNSVVDILTKLG